MHNIEYIQVYQARMASNKSLNTEFYDDMIEIVILLFINYMMIEFDIFCDLYIRVQCRKTEIIFIVCVIDQANNAYNLCFLLIDSHLFRSTLSAFV